MRRITPLLLLLAFFVLVGLAGQADYEAMRASVAP